MNKFFIQTFGCQMNAADSEIMRDALAGRGLSPAECVDDADVVVVNTCSVRDHAENRAASFIGRRKPAKKSGKLRLLVVAGCMAQRAGREIIRRLPHVDLVVGAQEIEQFAMLIAPYLEAAAAGGKPPAPSVTPVSAFVTIMRGCENFCSYCIVPHVRGKEKSRPAAEVIEDIARLAAGGAREVTLLGQNVNSYRSDTVDFSELLARISGIAGLARIRFMTSHPKDLNDRLIEAMATLPKVCGHLHLPLQSGSDRILAAMNRGYTAAGYRGLVERLRRRIPAIALSTDVMVGFPGETEEDFARTLEMIRETAYEFLYAFKYSPRPLTASARLPDDVPEGEKERRLAAALETADGVSALKNATIAGTVQEVLVEREREGRLEGRAGNNRKIYFDGPSALVGGIVKVRVTAGNRNSLTGQRIN